jgi:hypothetical protein
MTPFMVRLLNYKGRFTMAKRHRKWIAKAFRDMAINGKEPDNMREYPHWWWPFWLAYGPENEYFLNLNSTSHRTVLLLIAEILENPIPKS